MRRFSSSLLWIGLVFTTLGCVKNSESGRSSLILIPESQEISLGQQAFSQVLNEEPQSRNYRATEIVNQVGRRIAQAANRPDYRWDFRLLRSAQKNAFCLPGGKIAVYTGILSLAKNEAGLATVLGHEVAHATSRHAGQRITTNLIERFGFLALGTLINVDDGNEMKQILMAALGLGAQVGVDLPFSRGQESEADAIGLRYMARAGYDPREAPRFWDRFAALSQGNSVPTFLSTHPSDVSRKRALTEALPSVIPVYEKNLHRYGLGLSLSDGTAPSR